MTTPADYFHIDFNLPSGMVITRWIGDTYKIAIARDRVEELAGYLNELAYMLLARAPVQPGGNIPPGTIAMHEFQFIYQHYAMRQGVLAHTKESILSRGGFTYQEIQEYLSKDPETWKISG